MSATPTTTGDPRRARLRVLMISAAFPPMVAGEAGHAFHLATHLAAAGADVHVLTTDRPGTRDNHPFATYPVMRGWGWRRRRRLAAVMRQVQPDAIVLIYAGWNYGHHPMVTLSASLARRVVPGARFVTQVEYPSGADSSRLPLPARAWSKAVRLAMGGGCDYAFGTLLADSDAVIALGHHHLEALARRDPGVAQKARVLAPPPLLAIRADADGAARREGRARLGIADDQTLLAYIGLIAPGKGIETLLAALARAARTDPKLRLAMIGGVVSEGLAHHGDHHGAVRGLCSSLRLDDRVIWCGAFDPAADEASVFLRAADVAVLPWDAGVRMNNSSVANVAAHGLPLVTTRPDRLEPIFEDGGNVLLCPPRDPGALAEAIGSVVGDAALRRRLAEGARRLARQWYDWDATAGETLALLGADNPGVGAASDVKG